MSDPVRELVTGTRHGRVAVLTINRPERRNALNLRVKQELIQRLRTFEQESDVAALVLTGAGGCFVAGTDIAEMANMTPSDHARLDTARVFQVVRRLRKPVIAAVEGYALGGGCELALACDIVVAAEDAEFGQPEIRVGIMPGAGGTQRLLRSAGRYKTLLWTLTGMLISASEAAAANLVSELVPAGRALPRSIEIASMIAAMPPLSVEAIREVVRQGEGLPLEDALAMERQHFERLFDTHDQKEGMRAFLEKRPAAFVGR